MQGAIKAIDRSSVHQITSGQVIVDLQTAVKELLENSFDAGATSVEVRFKEYGVNAAEVVDNGCGISENDYDSIALKHHTSKLGSFEDLGAILTFGFRGEALSSLCALCESLTVATCTGRSDQAFVLQFENDGRVKSKSRVARQRGTTVTFTNLFHPLPVRRLDLERNAKREFSKALTLLHAYALVPCSKGVRLSVWNTLGNKKTSLLQTPVPSSASLSANIRALYGPKSTDNLIPLELSFNFEPEKSVLKRLGLLESDPTKVTVSGLISKFSLGCGRTTSDRQFLYLNGRPWAAKKVLKILNEVYRSFNTNQSPSVMLDFKIPTDAVDINVTPDKRTLFVHSESKFLQGFKDALEDHFSPERAVFDMSTQAPTKTLAEHAKPVDVTADNEKPNATDEMVIDTNDTATIRVSGSSRHPIKSKPRPEADIDVESLQCPSPTQMTSPIPSITLKGPAQPLSEQVAISSSLLADESRLAASSTSDAQDHLAGEILSTENASWNVRRSENRERDGYEPQPKKRRLEDASSDGGFDEIDPVVMEAMASSDGITYEEPLDILHSAKDVGEEIPTTSSVQLVGGKSRRQLRTSIKKFAKPGLEVTRLDGEESADEPDRSESSSDLDRQTSKDNDDPDPELAREENAEGSSSKSVDTIAEIHVVDLTLDGSELLEGQPDLGTSSPGPRTKDLSSLDLRKNATRPEIVRTGSPENAAIRFDASKIIRRWQLLGEDLQKTMAAVTAPPKAALGDDASITNVSDNAKAAVALSRVIAKDDFNKMGVIGQFNKDTGKTGMRDSMIDDIFIVDQHAADEKYNFETLQLTTKIDSQKFFQPLPLELTAAAELTAMENMEILRQNGFEVSVDEADPEGGCCRLKLVAQPVSKSTVFDVKDLEELIQLMQDRPSGQMVRCSKARAMFASRACRKSIMVGMPLTKGQMKSIIQHMGSMEQPWNCPHGRPTMRYLSDISGIGTREKKLIDWTNFTHTK